MRTSRSSGRRGQSTVLVGAALLALVIVAFVSRTGSERAPEIEPNREHSALELGWHRARSTKLPASIDDLAPVLPGIPPLSVDRPPEGPVLMNFWATTCAPCREELPLLERASVEHPSGVRVVGISRDRFVRYPRAMIEQKDVTYANYLDPDGQLMEDLAHVMPANAVPSSLLMVDGRVVSVHVGAFGSYRDLVDGIRTALAPAP